MEMMLSGLGLLFIAFIGGVLLFSLCKVAQQSDRAQADIDAILYAHRHPHG